MGHVNWKCTPQDFLVDYKKSRCALKELLENGADAKELSMDIITADHEMGRSWDVYRDLRTPEEFFFEFPKKKVDLSLVR